MEHMARLHWVVALRPEADAVIRRFRLRPCQGARHPYPVYRSEDGSSSLVLSGLGKVRAAAATAYLGALDHQEGLAGWINFGVCGSGRSEFGATFLASKVIEESSGRAWYPASIVARRTCPERREVRTVDAPVSDYPGEGCLVEMEASGFLEAASSFVSGEFCQVVKTVSDDPDHPMESVDREKVARLCRDGLEKIEDWVMEFSRLVAEARGWEADPPGFTEWTEAIRFSATQTHQLRRLLQQWQVREGSPDREAFPPVPEANARAALEELRAKIWRADSGAIS